MNELQLIYDIATNLSDYLICIGILTFLWLVGMDDGLRERSTDMSGNNQNDDDLKRRLRKHNDERLYLEADELMCEAADRIEQLESELESHKSDSTRLDWIEKELFQSHWNGVVDSGSKTHWRIAEYYRHTVAKMEGATFRKAIDACISKLKDQS